MRVSSVTCKHCGGPLDVPPKTRFVTCRYCGSRLEIHRNESTVYTEVLEAFGKRIDHLARETDVLRLQNSLKRLDREWEMEREEYKKSDGQGGSFVPTLRNLWTRTAWMVGIAIVVMLGAGIIGISLGTKFLGLQYFLFVIVYFAGPFWIVSALVSFAAGLLRVIEYEEAKRHYEEERQHLILEIHRIRDT